MKYTFCFLALLLIAVTAQAQATTGNLYGHVTDNLVVEIEPGANTLYTTPDGEVFRGIVIQNDSLLDIKDTTVETARGEVALVLVSETTLTLDCPDGLQARFFADETRRYQLGICPATRQRRHTGALVHVNGSVGR